MAASKLALSIFVILVAVPLICRLLPQPQPQLQRLDVPAPTGWDLTETRGQESWTAAAMGFVLGYLKNLWFIVKTTVPLMLLAGVLGAVVGTLFPQDLIVGLGFSLLVLLAIALIGTFLPVPMSFDVVLAGALLAGGLTHGYVFALVFTLGSFSVYSYMIVATTISARAASLVAGAIVALGVIGGAAAHSYHSWQTQRALEMLLGLERALLPAAAHAAAPEVSVEARPFAPRSRAGDTPFIGYEAKEIGIDKPIEFSMVDMWPPFWEGRSLSSGDFDGDGDLDLVVASTEVGLYLYENDGSGQFTRISADLGRFRELDIFNAALVDLDNDGWLDLFLASYITGNFVVWNREGAFDFAAATAVQNREDAMLSMALSFGDVDRDGDLDAVLGNWAAGWYRRIPGEESRNRLLFNQGRLDGQAYAELSGLPGETLSVLLSDINLDGALDLLVGNDFELPDYIYRGDGAGSFAAITRDEGLVPHTTNTTMAIKSGDLHNSGAVQLYFAQIAGRSSGVSDRLNMQDLSRYCDRVVDPADKAVCQRNMQIKSWYRSGNRFDPTYAARCQELQGPLQQECKAMLVKDLAIQKQDASVCGLIPANQPLPRVYCDIHFKPFEAPLMSVFNTTIPQIRQSNVLLTPDGPGYSDTAVQEQLEVGGWSWDTKLGDFNNDGLQDVFIVNGTWVPNEVSPSNMFFLNTGGVFEEQAIAYGLEDYLMTAAALRFDMDGDGDLDLLTHPVNGPLMIYENATQTGNALTIALRDARGNSHGVGARVTATLADGTVMMRELQSGGGFMSFDAPVAHFGLGAATEARITVHWPTGAATTLPEPLAAGAAYTLTRP
jgi:hypothetical protein